MEAAHGQAPPASALRKLARLTRQSDSCPERCLVSLPPWQVVGGATPWLAAFEAAGPPELRLPPVGESCPVLDFGPDVPLLDLERDVSG